MMSRFAVCSLQFAVFLRIAATAGAAGVVEETLTLSEGWNAVYLEATPAEGSAAAEFFAGLPVTKASCYVSSAYSATSQFASDGSEIVQKPVSHLVYDANDPSNSTLQQICGGQVYLMFATNTATKTYLGTPNIPRVSWQVSDGGFATFVPVLAPRGTEVLAADYLDGAPCGAQKALRPYSIFGEDEAELEVAPLSVFTRKPKLTGGAAYVFESEKAGDWPGVIEVTAGLAGEMAFSDGVDMCSVSVRNMSTTNREVRVSLAASERDGDVAPQLFMHVPQTMAGLERWEEFTATNVVLAAGEARTLVFRCDKSQIASGASRSAVFCVEDTGASKMRVRLPVSAVADTYAEGTGAYPAGLWVGTVKLLQVSDKDGNLMNVGKPLDATAILHVDGNGAMTLLQRIVVAQERDGETGKYRATLYKELSDVPDGMAARRISSLFIDTANRATAAASGSAFGNDATFAFTVAETSKENPFRHAWHPDHDGKRADYSGATPSGDVPENFIGSIKPESFSVTNTLAFVWRDDNGKSTYSATPDETTFGRLDWTLTGLRKETIKMRGLFVLKRVSNATEIK